MFEIYYTNEFKKQLKLMIKRGKNADIMNMAIEILGNTGTLPVVPYRTHKLSGDLVSHYEAHLEPDWLLIWKRKSKQNNYYLNKYGYSCRFILK